MEKNEGVYAKGIILGGFISNGLRQLGISILCFILTGVTYFGAMQILDASFGYYMLYGFMFFIGAIGFAFFFRGLDYFYQMRRFLLYPDIKVNLNPKKVKTMAEVLEHIKIKELIYASKKVMITNEYLIVLKDEPSIYALNKIQAINKSSDQMKKGPAFITLNFYNDTKDITFASTQEAESFMEAMNQVQKA